MNTTLMAPDKQHAPSTELLNLREIRTDGGTQVRVELNEGVYLDYAAQMKGGATFPPVAVG